MQHLGLAFWLINPFPLQARWNSTSVHNPIEAQAYFVITCKQLQFKGVLMENNLLKHIILNNIEWKQPQM
jgi:hypothetical protein